MNHYQSDSDDGQFTSWKHWFLSEEENIYFCEVDDEYIADRFNLTGLSDSVENYKHALALITDTLEACDDEDVMDHIERSAAQLYGLIHARFIITSRGLTKMSMKFHQRDFGVCPRVMCGQYPLLPMGQSDIPRTSNVKLYCPMCEDIYNPVFQVHASIDGAYFGTTFHNMILQVYSKMVPPKPIERHQPRVFGFRVNAFAALQRWQDRQRDELVKRLTEAGIDPKFVEDELEYEYDDDADESFDFQATESQYQKQQQQPADPQDQSQPLRQSPLEQDSRSAVPARS